MNMWNSYIDPGQQGGSQPSFNQRWPEDTQENIWSSAYRDLEPSDAMNMWKFAGGVPTDYDMPNFTNLDRGQRVTGWGADPQEKSAIARQMADAMTEALGNDPAMIRMGGKEFPNAFLHRALGDPKELDWWGKLFQKGMSSQKPTSAVTPSVLQTFKSEPYGLMFNVNDPNQLKHVAAADVASGRQISWQEDVEAQMRDVVGRIMDTWWQRKKSLPSGPQDVGIARKYSDAVSAAKQKILGNAPPIETWTPRTAQEYWLDPKTEGLDRLFLRQKWKLQDMDEPASQHLWHSELIPEIDRSMLAGVRLPLTPPKRGLWGDIPIEVEPGIKKSRQDKDIDLVRSLYNFAQEMNVPIFRFPAVETRAQQLKGLENPFSGNWGRPPRKDYTTSTELAKIFGITELP